MSKFFLLFYVDKYRFAAFLFLENVDKIAFKDKLFWVMLTWLLSSLVQSTTHHTTIFCKIASSSTKQDVRNNVKLDLYEKIT